MNPRVVLRFDYQKHSIERVSDAVYPSFYEIEYGHKFPFYSFLFILPNAGAPVYTL